MKLLLLYAYVESADPIGDWFKGNAVITCLYLAVFIVGMVWLMCHK